MQLARPAADLAVALPGQAPPDGLDCLAAEAAIRILWEQVNGRGGLIIIDHAGRIGFAHNTPHLARAYMVAGMSIPEVGI